MDAGRSITFPGPITTYGAVKRGGRTVTKLTDERFANRGAAAQNELKELKRSFGTSRTLRSPRLRTLAAVDPAVGRRPFPGASSRPESASPHSDRLAGLWFSVNRLGWPAVVRPPS